MFDDFVLAEPLFTSAGINRFSGRDAVAIVNQVDLRHGVGSFTMDLPETIHWSPAIFDLYGYPYEDRPVRLDEVLKPLFPQDRVRLGELVKNAIRHKVGYHSIVRVTRPNWDVRLMEIYADVIVSNEKTSSIVGTVQDITHKATQVRAPVDDWGFVTAMAGPAALLDGQMRVLACSDAWLRCFALAGRKQTIGKTLPALCPGLPVGWSMDVERAMLGASVKASRDFFEPATGRKLACGVCLVPWKDASGNLVGALVNIGQWGLALASRPRTSRVA